MIPITKGTALRVWFAGQRRTATAARQIPGGLWWCTFPKPVEGCSGTIATRAALGDTDPRPTPTGAPNEAT